MSAEPLAPAARRGPIFIIGAMGSGTTLLRLMLDSHEHIAIPHETGFMRSYRAMQFVPFKWTGRGWARRLGWTDEELDAELRAFFERIFMRHAEREGKQRWGEKTPLHTWHVGAMAKLFPDAVFIGLVRHPGAATASNMTRFGQPVNKAAIHVERYYRELARVAARHPRRFVVLRYEDLVLRTEPAMRELLAWLGEPWSERVLEHHVVQAGREGRRVEGGSRADEPVDADRIAKWTRTLSAADRRVVEQRLGRLGEFFGYAMDDPERLARLTKRGGALVGGGELRRRMLRPKWADLELRKRGPVPVFERHLNPRSLWLIENETGEPPRRDAPPDSRARAAALAVARRMPDWARRRLRRVSGGGGPF